jgi:FimV-like protein
MVKWGPLLLAVGLLFPALVHSGVNNVASLWAARHLLLSPGCSAVEPTIFWSSDMFPDPHSVYWQAVFAAAGAPLEPPPAQAWQRDARFWAWFQAQFHLRNGRFAESYVYFEKAEAAPFFGALGHAWFLEDPVCGLISWGLAQELNAGSNKPVSGFVDIATYGNSFIHTGRLADVVQVYEQLLLFRPRHFEWRLMLARAYMQLGQRPEAEDVLQPVLREGTPEQQDRVRDLLGYSPDHD